MPQVRNLERPWLISAMLALAVFAAYLPAVYLGFLEFDDNFYLTRNPHVQHGLSWDTVQWAFTHFHAANWHPVTWLSHAVDYQLYGLNPLGHHVTNVVLHALNTILLFLWLRSMTGAVWRSALVAALFGLHPLRVESVAWVAERKDVLCAFFGILSLWAYSSYGRRARAAETELKGKARRSDSRRRIFFVLSLLFFALGLLCKPMLVTWPFVMWLLDFWPLDRLSPPSSGKTKPRSVPSNRAWLIVEKIPFFLVTAGSCVATYFAQHAGGAVSALGDAGVSLGSRLGNVPVNYSRYILKVLWPSDLAVIYPFVKSWPLTQVLCATLLLVAITGAALWTAKRHPYFPVGWLWYVGTLVPVIGLVQVGTQSIADRYTYIPGIGLAIVAAWGLAELASRINKSGLVTTAVLAILLGSTWFTGRQLLYWQNTETLFAHTVAVTKGNYSAETILGAYLSDLGEFEPAKYHFRQAIKITLEFPDAWNNLGCALVNQRRYDEAVATLEAAANLRPHSADIRSNLGNALFGLGKTNEALTQYTEAVRLDPGLAGGHYNLAYAFMLMDRLPEAADEFREALRINPAYSEARINLGGALAKQGKFDEAATEFNQVLRQNPSSVIALCGYGAALIKQSKWDDAAVQYSKALQLAPNNYQALLQLGIIQNAQGKTADAVQTFSHVLAALPDEPNAHYYLGSALAASHRPRDAVEHYRLALKFAPDFPEALNNLAWILAASPDATLRNGPEAVARAEQACRLTDYKQPIIVGTLAAAYAEAGRFDDAVATATKARAIAESQGDTAVATRNAELLELYRSKKPYRDNP